MSNGGRVAITCVVALLVGAVTYGSAVDLDRDGIIGTVFFSAPVAVLVYVALPILTVALVYRWWALSVALVPLAVLYFLHSATNYVYPFHEDPYPAITVFLTVILLGVASLGLLLRAGFDRLVA